MQWICSYRECDKEFTLTPRQQSLESLHYCSRSHAASELKSQGKLKDIHTLDKSTFSPYGTGVQATRNVGKPRKRATRTVPNSGVLVKCELEGCENFVCRYPYQIALGKGRFCSQSHSSKWAAMNSLFQSKECERCSKIFAPTRGNQRFCSPCRPASRSEKSREWMLSSKFGITQEDYDKMWIEQGGKCAICGGDGNDFQGIIRLAVDHNHTTGNVRALLCLHCNTRLGWLEPNFEAVMQYLKQHGILAQSGQSTRSTP